MKPSATAARLLSSPCRSLREGLAALLCRPATPCPRVAAVVRHVSPRGDGGRGAGCGCGPGNHAGGSPPHTAGMHIEVEKHVAYCAATLTLPLGGGKPLPAAYTSADAQRMTLVYFSLAALDVLGALHRVVDAGTARAICDWIYTCAVPADVTLAGAAAPLFRGFDGGAVAVFAPAATGACVSCLSGNVAMSYAAVATLILLGDDLSRLDVAGIAATLPTLQLADGNVRTHGPAGEADVRFVYSAVALAALLRLPPAALDWAAARRFILACQAAEGGFGLVPGAEAHGGSTYCALAALRLIDTHYGAYAAASGDARPRAAAVAPRARRWLAWRQRDVSLSDDAALADAAGRMALASLKHGAAAAAAAAVAAAVPAAAAVEGAAAAAAPAAEGAAEGGSTDGDDTDSSDARSDGLPPEARVALAGPGGMTGRPGKPSDSCYTFWVGASLAALGVPPAGAVDVSALAAFVDTCQFSKGGFGKDCESYPDPMHTYYALAGLSLAGHPQLAPLDPLVSLSHRALAALPQFGTPVAATSST